ncbi:ATP-binding protein [Clostridium botulinum]|uniref:ATP-binding protein n=1 Tax=Clostridium botulinum TaxID=1491 RepID=A0A0L9Y447_CLOBO|nr:AAA family ATPase [Clostridium botulinum]KAI3349977.1 AAA family ATPase [Clostridium botulinum]KOM86580.1 transcriptional antiterminator [Clostridium botulinum]KOR55314.1 transcriptional antiterminator [Clostridium botulinum]NFA41588.1 ATP-binding protein [Clostridium botulinum]NFR81377.1 ATP-binding protein [Clostridium botulinum]
MGNDVLDIQSILKGEIIYNPKYNKQIIEEYKNNPCIEALPNIFDDEFVVKELASYPQISNHGEIKNENVRYHLIKSIKSYYQPLSCHLKIEHTLSCIIRRSYIARNPASKEYLQRIRLILEVMGEKNQNNINIIDFDVCKNLSDKFSTIPETTRSSAECFSIIGISGMGKSTAIEKLLLMYPQVIIHRKYKGKPLTRTQITWLKIDCPYDGSIKTLCKMFFKALDDVLLTTNYFITYASYRNSAATMMIHMAHLASLHSIGVLVIDEMQHLINHKNKPSEILNFLVTLTNTIGISIVQIGTPKLNNVLTKGLRELRRAEESGSIFWGRMKEDEEWDFFIENLWEEQILKNYTPINDKLKQAMYYETQGITAITINLFILIQVQAIFNNSEKITVNLIHNVAKKDLRLTNRVIQAIRSNNPDEMANYEDISIEIENVIQDKIQEAQHRERVRELSNQYKESVLQNNKQFKETLITEVMSIGLFVYIDYDKLEKIVDKIVKGDPSKLNTALVKQKVIMAAMEEENRIVEKNNQISNSKEKTNLYDKGDLRNLFDESVKKKVHIYDVLKDNGYIKDPLQELY